ncbi:MAG: hypothetical protein JW838_16355 [Spirochaetes bacterium]|nr:hypothetical protein [Spirochaetota bacterium]
MKRRLVACALLLAALIPGCAKEDQEKIIPGYLSPGQFRPRGVLDDKEISFTGDLSSKNCSGEDCLAIYTTWLVGSFLVSGFAISDKNSATPTYSMKVTQDLVGWRLILIIERSGTQGVKYEKIISGNDFTVEFCKSDEYALPACTSPPCDEEYEDEGGLLVRATITFNNPITLENADHGDIVISAGNRIVAQAYNVSTSETCP